MKMPKSLISSLFSRALAIALAFQFSSSARAQELLDRQTHPFISWQTMTSFAREALKHTAGHEVNSMILEFEPNPAQPGRNFATLIDDLALDDCAPKSAKKGQARRDVAKLRASIAEILKEARGRHIDAYLMESEVSFPPGMLEAYPEAGDVTSPFLWRFLESRLEEVLQALPDAAGVVLYTDEPNDLILYALEGVDRRVALNKLLEVYHKVCRRNGRRLIVSTFVDYDAQRLEMLLSALKQIPPADDLLVDNYICPSDWGFIQLLNPAIGNVGGHREFLTVDYTGEVWGQANIPLCEAELIPERVRAALQKGANLVGINGYVSWYTQNIFGKPSEMNLALAPQFLRDPTQDPHAPVRDWLAQRYGERAAEGLVPAFLNSFEVAMKSIQTLGFWVSEAPKSAFPDPVWIDFSLRTESLAVFDPSYKALEDQLVYPDASILVRVIQEKDTAVSLASQALRAVEQSRPYLKDADFQQLHHQFSLALYVARAYRLYIEMYMRFRMWDQSGRGPVPPELSQLERQIRGLAAEMEKAVDSPPVFCPKSLLSDLAMLQGFLDGRRFPNYPTSLVYGHTIKYPPIAWGSCARQP
jgi:hypothetical protein